jgi:hypothetical protein
MEAARVSTVHRTNWTAFARGAESNVDCVAVGESEQAVRKTRTPAAGVMHRRMKDM